MSKKQVIDEFKATAKKSSFDIQDIKGDINHAKVVTHRNGKTHEVIILAFTEDDLNKLNNLLPNDELDIKAEAND